MDSKWNDILITDRDITLDVAGIPENVASRASIEQDIKHMILASGLLVDLVAQRSPHKWAENTRAIEMLVEDDVRILPGSVIIKRDPNNHGRLFLVAKTAVGAMRLIMTNNSVEAGNT